MNLYQLFILQMIWKPAQIIKLVISTVIVEASLSETVFKNRSHN